MRIRNAQHEDVPALAWIHRSSFTHERPWTAKEFAELMGLGGTIASLAEKDGQPRGFILYRVMPEEAEILTLAVEPAFQRQGIGKALVEKMLAHVQIGRRGQPVTRVLLDVAQDNAAALRLYEGCGFKLLSRRKGYYTRAQGPACDALVMTKPLA